SAFYLSAGEGPPAPVNTETILDDLQARLDDSLLNTFAGLKVDRIAEIGDPAQEIVSFAHTHSVDLIMMPSHGYGPFRSHLLGSVTAKVLHDASCPVWTATHVAERPRRDHLACRTIICAVDGTRESVSLIRWAADIASDTGAVL